MKILRLLAFAVTAAFLLLIIVGFDNVLAIFRSRVALALFIAPVFFFFIWCLYKAIQTRHRLPGPTNRDR